MQKRKLGWTDLEISVIGIGTWALGGPGWKFSWGPQDDNDTIKTIHKAIDMGINWIDTAPVYGLGHAEEIVGKAIKGIRKDLIIATKCGRRWKEDGKELYGNLKKEEIKKECDASLKRLNINFIDLYQIHWPQPEEDIEKAWMAILELIKEGKVRYAGVSNFNTEQMKRIMHINKIASLQPPYNILRREIEEKELPFCKENNIGVITYSPLERGLLTGKVTRQWVLNLPDDDHRKKDPKFNEPQLSENIKVVNKLKDVADKFGITISQLAIAWILRRQEVTAVIVGARNPKQIEETAKAGDIKQLQFEI
ncbi:MAG: aldo/keto reductase [Candidatus Goldbacteria bacterium]|nr:aldo/keto reductase [Candidatus Goldiibacteriota bacterium]